MEMLWSSMSNPTERTIIGYIRKRFPKRRRELVEGIGDDAAVFRNGFVISTDSFVEGVHFDMNYFTYYALGYHCLGASLSDLAAMAALPICAFVSLHLTAAISMKEIEQLHEGFRKVAGPLKCDLAGGDVVTSPVLGISITVVGRSRKVLFRSGARPGNSLFVTNFLGLAEVGRRVLRGAVPRKDYPVAIAKHLFPAPRIQEAQVIRRYADSCIDVSDGLSTDAFHLAEESSVKITIDAEHVPIHSEVGEYCSKEKIEPLNFILASGEDFELLFTASHVPKIPGVNVFRIGQVVKGSGLFLSSRGREKRIEPTGYEHLTQHGT
jgi:thiamine-monophosphate kinase